VTHYCYTCNWRCFPRMAGDRPNMYRGTVLLYTLYVKTVGFIIRNALITFGVDYKSFEEAWFKFGQCKYWPSRDCCACHHLSPSKCLHKSSIQATTSSFNYLVPQSTVVSLSWHMCQLDLRRLADVTCWLKEHWSRSLGFGCRPC
jgi:hypothetical protein